LHLSFAGLLSLIFCTSPLLAYSPWSFAPLLCWLTLLDLLHLSFAGLLSLIFCTSPLLAYSRWSFSPLLCWLTLVYLLHLSFAGLLSFIFCTSSPFSRFSNLTLYDISEFFFKIKPFYS
jgi:hypothetical protein